MRRKLLTFAVAIFVGTSALLLFRESRNEIFEYCTTAAYGFPLPWRVDHCLCGGGDTVYPMGNALTNILAVLVFATVAGLATPAKTVSSDKRTKVVGDE